MQLTKLFLNETEVFNKTYQNNLIEKKEIYITTNDLKKHVIRIIIKAKPVVLKYKNKN